MPRAMEELPPLDVQHYKGRNLNNMIVLLGEKNNFKERERERNVLFNDALNTFYLRLYGVRHMVKDHSDSEKGNPVPPHIYIYICTLSD